MLIHFRIFFISIRGKTDEDGQLPDDLTNAWAATLVESHDGIVDKLSRTSKLYAPILTFAKFCCLRKS